MKELYCVSVNITEHAYKNKKPEGLIDCKNTLCVRAVKLSNSLYKRENVCGQATQVWLHAVWL